MRRRIAVVVAALFIFSFLFSSCSPNRKAPTPPVPQESVAVGGNYKVVWQSLEAPEKEDLQVVRLAENAVYFSTYSYSGYATSLYRINDGEKTAIQIAVSTEIGDEFAVGKEGTIWSVDYKIVETIYEETDTGNLPPPHCDVYLQMLQADGTLGAERLILENAQGVVAEVQTTDHGVPYWIFGDVLYWAPTGDLNALQQVSPTEGVEYRNLYALGDGGMAVKVYDSKIGESAVRRVDAATGTLGAEIKGCTGENVTLYDGSGGYLLVKRDGDVVYGLTDGEGWTAIVDLAAYELGEYQKSTGLSGGYYPLCRMMADGGLLMMDREYDLCRMTPCAAEEVATVVTVAGCGLGNLPEAARLYNKTQSDYIVRTKEYSSAGTMDGSTKLTAELMAGTVPDVLCVDNFLPVRALIARNALEDLYPYLESDAELNADYFVDGVLKAFESDGGLYQIAADFTMETMFADEDVVGDITTLTPVTLTELQAAHPDTALFFSEFMQEELMSYVKTAAVTDYIDWTGDATSFDSESFVQLITLASTLPTMQEVIDSWNDDSEVVSSDQSIQTGDILLAQSDIPSLWRYAYIQKLMNNRAVFLGYPAENGKGTVLTATNRFAIMSTAAQKEGAWEFIRWMIQYQNDTMDITVSGTPFPASREAFERAITYYQDENATYCLTETDVVRLREMIVGARSALDYDTELATIIDEECAKFFRGSCTAQEAAAKIQSRAQLYVSEQT